MMATKAQDKPLKVVADNKPDPKMAIWEALAKTDPKHTKPFSRAGGFKGTALKPIWIVKRLTEQFGPCGVGWGIGEPVFQVVPCGAETMVYCTVQCWHNNGVAAANPVATLYGVGGDKVVTERQRGPFCDDEAFKKAFTDAVNNAFKFIGVGADIHMGQFDDSKYVAEVAKEFAPVAEVTAKEQDGDFSPTALKAAIKRIVHHLNGVSNVAELDDYLAQKDTEDTIEQCKRRAPAWWETGEGMPAEFTPLKKIIADTRMGLWAAEETDSEWKNNPMYAG